MGSSGRSVFLGEMHRLGHGEKLNYDAAVEHFTKAANQSDYEWAQRQAMLRLTRCVVAVRLSINKQVADCEKIDEAKFAENWDRPF